MIPFSNFYLIFPWSNYTLFSLEYGCFTKHRVNVKYNFVMYILVIFNIKARYKVSMKIKHHNYILTFSLRVTVNVVRCSYLLCLSIFIPSYIYLSLTYKPFVLYFLSKYSRGFPRASTRIFNHTPFPERRRKSPRNG